MSNEEHGFEILQGSGSFSGELIGGCMEVLNMIIGTDIWPLIDKWENKVLFLETSEGKPSPDEVACFLRHLSALGIINKLNGIIIGKPKGETYYEEYKSIIKKVISIECNKKDLPILYNVNFGHSAPMCILPFGSLVTIDLEKKQIILEDHPLRRRHGDVKEKTQKYIIFKSIWNNFMNAKIKKLNKLML